VKYKSARGNKALSKGLVLGGKEFSYDQGTPLYVCRGFYRGNYIPGKYLSRHYHSACHFSWEGDEHQEKVDFELMKISNSSSSGNNNSKTLRWVELNEEEGIPNNADVVEGGKSRQGEQIYVIRCQMEGDKKELAWTPGRYGPSQDHAASSAYVGYGSTERQCKGKVEFLTCS